VSKDGRYIVAYDIEDDRERSRISKALLGYGFRVQKSVFECRLTSASLRRLMGNLETLEIKSGCVLIYRLSEAAKRIKIGDCPGIEDQETYAYVI
jgi:CRISPR-associated protein Cas2